MTIVNRPRIASTPRDTTAAFEKICEKVSRLSPQYRTLASMTVLRRLLASNPALGPCLILQRLLARSDASGRTLVTTYALAKEFGANLSDIETWIADLLAADEIVEGPLDGPVYDRKRTFSFPRLNSDLAAYCVANPQSTFEGQSIH
mgnify:CR=1 FL=1